MKNKLSQMMTTRLLAVVALSTFLAGCSAHMHVPNETMGTSVNLSRNNYKVIKAAARGDSSGFNLLGIIPLASPSYANAKTALYKSVQEPLNGKAVALANQMEERHGTYLILFSIPTLTLTADVIEFTDTPDK
jgi:outer membrane PBP1 activator LpoA protein